MRNGWLLALWISSPAGAAESRAEALMLAGRVEEALQAAQAEAAAAPEDLEAHERYIDLLLTKRRSGLAASTYRDRVQQAPTEPDAHYLLGRAVTTAQEAREAYEKALRLDPNHARSHMGMGAVHRALGSFAESEAAYRRALALDPGLGEAWAGLGAALRMQGRDEEALQTARSALRAVPGESDAYITIAALAPAEAEEVLAAGARANPADPRIPVTLAETRLARGDGAGALEACQRALQLAPGDLDAQLLSLYAAEVKEGRLDTRGYAGLVSARQRTAEDPVGVLDDLDAIVAAYPSSALARMARAQPRARTGDLEGAISDLRRAHELDPENTEVRGSLGLLLVQQGMPEEARPHLEAALAERPRDLSLSVALGRADAATGRLDAARARLEAAQKAAPGSAEVVLAYAGVLAQLEESELAYRVLSDAASRGSDARVVLALAAAARDVGRFDEAAALVEQLGRQLGQERLHDLADQLRQQGAAAEAQR